MKIVRTFSCESTSYGGMEAKSVGEVLSGVSMVDYQERLMK